MILMSLWLAGAVFSTLLAVLKRLVFWMLPAVGFTVATVLAWMHVGWVYQVGMIVVTVIACMSVREIMSAPAHELHRDYVESRMSESASLMGAMSTYGELDEDVIVYQWQTADSAEIVFHGRPYKVKLNKGSRAVNGGAYRVLGAKAGRMLVEEVKY